MKTIRKGNVKGNPRLEYWANDYPVFWPGRGRWQSKQKQCEPKLFGSQARFVCEAKCAGNHTRDSRAPDGWTRKRGGGQGWLQITVVWLSTDSRCSKAAEALCVPKRNFGTEEKSSGIGGRKSCWRKCVAADGKGICRNSWRKSMRCPRRLRIPSLNKIAQTAARPYSFMGILRSELFPGFYRCIAKWKSPLIRSIVPEPNHRHSAQRQQRALMLVPFAPLGCKGIRSVSLRWWSFQSLKWSQVLTSVPN